jgi:PiT family inorganic phosphate transporter
VDFSRLIVIAESWIVCPVLVMALAFGLLRLVGLLLSKFAPRTPYFQNVMGWLTILSSCYVSYSLGANHAGVAVGLIANLGTVHLLLLLFIGGCSIAAGSATYGKKVTDTIGKGITPLDIPGAFVAQISSGFGIHLFSLLGIPVSTSSAIVGAVVGVGLVKGTRAISKRTISMILIGWVLTPALAAASSFVLYKTIEALMK